MALHSTYSDVQANPVIGEKGKINIFLPEVSGKHPFILGIHGGAWWTGDHYSYSHFWPRIMPTGLAFVTCSYRLAPANPYPAAYLDLVHVLKWLKTNGNRFHLDVDRCVLMGGLRATREERDICGIKALVDYCGIMDLAAQVETDRKRI